jgi:hypothetical protein
MTGVMIPVMKVVNEPKPTGAWKQRCPLCKGKFTSRRKYPRYCAVCKRRDWNKRRKN